MAAHWQSAEAEDGELICDLYASATAAWIYPAESFLDQHGSISVKKPWRLSHSSTISSASSAIVNRPSYRSA